MTGGAKESKWHVLRGYHAFRHSFASNLAATLAVRLRRSFFDEVLARAVPSSW